MRCGVDGERVIVEVVDDGGGIVARADSPGIGHGLVMVGALAVSDQPLTGASNRRLAGRLRWQRG